jgi:hypothetical protein
MARDEFSKGVRERAAARVGQRCSNPNCQKLTSGPAVDPARSIRIGEAAHIAGASPGGPRFDPTQSAEQRTSIDNAIWLCAACATLIDRDSERFSAALLRQWRDWAEGFAAKAIAAGSEFRAISANEVRQELTVAEVVVIKYLEEEFGCHVETNLRVQTNEGWLQLDGAVVRGEDLIAVDIRENHGRGIAYFQVEYLLELCTKLKFPRFQKCAVYLVVISDGPKVSDLEVEDQLNPSVTRFPVETHIRMLRLNEQRAKFGI